MNPNNNPRPYCTPEDLALEQMVNSHADRARRRHSDTARLDRFWGALTWSIYLAAFLVLIWGTNIARAAGMLAPSLSSIVIVALILGCALCVYKLVTIYKGGMHHV